MTGSVAVVSGGLDSVTALYLYVEASAEGARPLVVTFDYGQPAAKCEKAASAFFAGELGLSHRVVELPWMAPLVPEALIRGEADDEAVWIPNRNGVFIAAAAALSEGMGGGDVILGFNRDEGASFPDNTPEFIDAANEGLRLSAGGRVRVVSPTVDLSKVEMAARAREMGVDTSRLWSCYGSGEYHCGVCPSCKRLFSALEAAGVPEDARPGRL